MRLCQPATELSGGEAQRIKLATELQRNQRGATLYVLDEPTTGLHPRDVDRLLEQLDTLVTAGHTVIVVEHEMRVVAQSDWVIDIGPGAGDEGGKIVVAGTPQKVAASKKSRAPFLARPEPITRGPLCLSVDCGTLRSLILSWKIRIKRSQPRFTRQLLQGLAVR